MSDIKDLEKDKFEIVDGQIVVKVYNVDGEEVSKANGDIKDLEKAKFIDTEEGKAIKVKIVNGGGGSDNAADINITPVEGLDSTNVQEAIQELKEDMTGLEINGVPGPKGDTGNSGADGKSAYQVAVQNGFVGTEAQWLASLKGADGVIGHDGADGKSAYQVAVQNGFVGTEAEWIASLKGTNGTNGINGIDGKSAYVSAVQNGFVGTEAEWIASLKGEDGVIGRDGSDGKSAYQLYVMEGGALSQIDWLLSLKGEKGDIGLTGERGERGERGFAGEKGERGETGPQGEPAKGAVYYLHSENSSLAGFKKFSRDIPDSLANSYSVTCLLADTEYLIEQFITEDGDPPERIVKGLRTFNTFTKVSSIDGETKIRIKGYKRTQEGVETLIYTSETSKIVDVDSQANYTSNYTLSNDVLFAATDRFVIKYFAISTSSSSVTVSLYIEDEASASCIQTPNVIGTRGPQGPRGEIGLTGLDGIQGPRGEIGLTGEKGIDGLNGKSAYELYLSHGGLLSETEWLASLKGEKGDKGDSGNAGKSAYEIYVLGGGILSEAQWLASLKGETGTAGTNGTNGIDGKSAYQVAVQNGFAGTEAQWLLSLKGETGATGPAGPAGAGANFAPFTLTSSSNYTAIDFTNSNFNLSMTENSTLQNPSNISAGQTGVIVVTQNATASKTLLFGSYWKSYDGTTQSIAMTLNAKTIISYYVVSSTEIWFSISNGGVY